VVHFVSFFRCGDKPKLLSTGENKALNIVRPPELLKKYRIK
jgi:hypothetical protein